MSVKVKPDVVYVVVNYSWSGGAPNIDVCDTYEKAVIKRKVEAENYCWADDAEKPDDLESDIWRFDASEFTIEIYKEVVL